MKPILFCVFLLFCSTLLGCYAAPEKRLEGDIGGLPIEIMYSDGKHTLYRFTDGGHVYYYTIINGQCCKQGGVDSTNR